MAQAKTTAATKTAGVTEGTGKDLLEQFKQKELGVFGKLVAPGNTERQAKAESIVAEMIRHVLDGTVTVSDDALETINAVIAELDRKLSAQINEIIHNQKFQKLEATWRGLEHLVKNSRTDSKLKIRVLNVKKEDLGAAFKKHKGAAWDQSPVFRKIYTEEYSQAGAEPFGCLIGDYYFDQSNPDVKVLEGMMKVAAAAHAPFIAAAAPGMLSLDSWTDLPKPTDIQQIFDDPEYAAWNSLRQSPDAAYAALTMPRFVSRLPYGAKTNPVDGFEFEEDVSDANHDKYCWSNSAFAMGSNINRAFSEDGWCTRIRGRSSGGTVEKLNVHTFKTDDGNTAVKCPTEVMIDDRREKELADCGFMPLTYWKNTDFAAFIGAQSIQKPEEREGKDSEYANANANLTARLPYMFAMCRFAHYLKCMVRDNIGNFTSREQMEQELNDWILNYVTGSPENASAQDKAERPLSDAKVVVTEDADNPGYYEATFYLKPHFQLEGLKTTLSLVSKLPSLQES